MQTASESKQTYHIECGDHFHPLTITAVSSSSHVPAPKGLGLMKAESRTNPTIDHHIKADSRHSTPPSISHCLCRFPMIYQSSSSGVLVATHRPIQVKVMW